MAYCEAQHVSAEIQTTAFSATTKPSIVQVETFCREISDEMNARFRGVGIPEPLDLTNREVETYARLVAIYGVAARACRVMGQLEKAKDFQDLYEKMLEDAIKNPETVSPSRPRSGVGPEGTAPEIADADRAFTRETRQW